MILATQKENDRSPTPIISNRSPPKDLLESLGRFELPSSVESDKVHTSRLKPRAPKFSCPDEEPIILQRSAIPSPQHQQLTVEGESESQQGGKPESRRRKYRKRRLFSSTPFSFSLLFPASRSEGRSRRSTSTTLVATEQNEISEENKLVRRDDRSITDANDVWLFIWEIFRSAMPMKFFRHIRITEPSWLFLPSTILYGNWKTITTPTIKALTVSKNQQLQLQRRKRRRSAQRRRERPVRISGLPNQGQTCFLNSVLQSLASLEPFLEYLEGIVQFQEEMDQVSLSASLAGECNSDDEGGGYGWFFFGRNFSKQDRKYTKKAPSFTKELLNLLKGINGLEGAYEDDDDDYDDELLLEEHEGRLTEGGLRSVFGQNLIGGRHNCRARRGRRKNLNPKALLHRVAKSNSQFSSYGIFEQQDAQELFASLMEVVIHDSELDASPSDRRLETVPDDGDESNLLSLSDLLLQLGNEQNSFAEESNCDSVSLITANKSRGHQNGHQRDFREEKKQDTNDCVENTETIAASSTLNNNTKAGIPIRTKPSDGLGQDPSVGVKTMRNIMSSITPSPLSGWLGSTLRCSKCKHVRPIQNAPFLDIPLVPTSVPNYLSKAYNNSAAKPVSPNSSPMPCCSLEECLGSFTSVERVQDVECRFCTIQEEVENLEEEATMLRGAVETTERRLNKKKFKDVTALEIITEGESWDQTQCLRDDLLKVENKINELKTMDPDEDDIDRPMHDDDAFLLGSWSDQHDKIPIHRCEAMKCLLLTRCPSILCCHVQRRYYDPSTNRMEKCVQFVEFPLILDLSPYCAYGQRAVIPWVAGSSLQESNVNQDHPSGLPWSNARKTDGGIPYRLQSVIEHRGNAFGGHYITYRRDHSGTWFCISDSRVTPVSWRQVQTCQAYMLFYEAI